MSSWSDREVQVLINIWGEENIQQELDGAVRNKTVFQKKSKTMEEEGFQRDWQQCRTKVKNLKREYRIVKDHNGETGRGRKTCKFYRELDTILGNRPATAPTFLLDSGTAAEENINTNGM